ncbi:Nucleolar protein 7 [Varanus komodoensis]|uniref:Nucleolar protein 7 n=1 Tax=Varanus komodoensis TaxID=61221 RepID=A0A8D2L1P3_VARKO|nr:nucleolar protein 7 [Varanus komodoensis]KAF7245163.1 Nucleolar protein 7 [Varanus komodoensis]
MVARRSRAARAGKEAQAEPAAFSSAVEEEEEEESDEAPEEVTFENARVAAEEARRLAGERARREKTLLKEKRRLKEELFKEQKKRKLLPENVLELLASSAQNSKNQPFDTPEQDQNIENDLESECGDTAEDGEKDILATKLQESYMAMRLKDQDLTNRQQQEAKAFIQRHLYGAGCNRTTANEYFSVKNKKSTVKKAAVQFVSKSWGKKKKQKAKQFKQRWVSSTLIA